MLIKYLDIDPTEFEDIPHFDWMIKTIARGYKTGKKISQKLGAGMEFNQYRPYSQGDDLRRLDWKMYARSDRYYIKESEIETQLEVTFVLDTSQSMEYQEGRHSKFKFAQLLIGVLGYLSLQEGDTIGLAAGGFQIAHQDERSWRRFVFELLEQKTDPSFEAPIIQHKQRKELFVVLTDHYDHNGDIPGFIEELKSNKNEVILFHLLGPKEKALDFKAGDRLRDLENRQVVAFNPSQKAKYQENINQWIHGLQQRYLAHGIDYLQIDFNTPFREIIQQVNQHRKALQ